MGASKLEDFLAGTLLQLLGNLGQSQGPESCLLMSKAEESHPSSTPSSRKYLDGTLGLSFPGGSDGEEPGCNAGDWGSIPGLGRSPGGGNGNPLQYFCLENPMDRGAWHRVGHD